MASFEFKGKYILIVSPEPWSHLFVSKHHYAIHLANRGSYVFFLNPPENEIRLENTEIEQLKVIHYKGFIKGIRFLPGFIQRYLMKRVFVQVQNLIKHKIDVVWSFDNSVFFDFRIFDKDVITISHIVDPNQDFQTAISARTAALCLCNTEVVKKRLSAYNRNVFKINHGFNVIDGLSEKALPGRKTIKVIYSGNLNLIYIDWLTIGKIINDNNDIDFVFIGPGDLNPLKKATDKGHFENVFTTGKVSANDVQAYLKSADVLLVCYQEKYQSDQVTNTHKLMEYLGSGKVVVSSFTKEFENCRDIVAMSNTNSELPALFKKVAENLEYYNSNVLVQNRISFAHSNTYDKQIDRIESIIQSL